MLIEFDKSQHGESTFIYKLIDGHLKKYNIPKVFVDIGAIDGIRGSNSLLFWEMGWEVHLFEPNPKQFEKAKNFFKSVDKYHLYPYAVSNKKGVMDFLVDKRYLGHSRLSNDGNIKVEKFYDHVKQNIGILDIDAEGFDFVIIKDMMYNTKIRPEIIIIEANNKNELNKQRKILKTEYIEIAATVSVVIPFFDV